MVTEDQRQADISASFLRAARAGNLEKVLEFLKGSIDINTSNANGLNALHLASKEGHVNIVSELLKRGANVNAATKKGNTALHIASLAGQEAVVKLLVQSGANVNVQSQNGFTPLYMAAQENHHSVVCFLLTSGANQSLATEDGFTPLAVSLQQGHDKVVTVLLENDAKGRVRLPALHIAAKKDDCKAAALLLQNDHNPDVTSKSGFTPLHIAAHYGNDNIGRLLLEKGAKVNYVAKHQITPLHVASKWGKSNMVILLIEKGAQIDALTKDGLTPLHCAARSGHDHVVDLLLERGAPVTAKTKNGLAPLHMASQADNVDCARTLLYHKAPVDDVTIDYLTALHVAAHCGHVKVAKILLDRKADPNARALNGFTPLHIACKKNRIKIVELLLKHGGSIEARTESGLTPLHVSAFMGNMNIVIFLIQHGADPDIPTVRGETPIHLAARANQADIIRILLRNGAHVDAKAREHQTPLHIAARLGNVDIVSLLIQHGAAVDATTKDMYTALHIAAKEGQEEVASLLLDNGASLTATTQKGFTSLHLTAKYGNIKVARILIQRNAPVDAQGKNGVTPLHVATHYDHVNVALLLLENGASPHAAAKNGYTSLHIAAKHSQMDIATTLLEYGAKANAETKTGFTPLHLASQEGHTDMTTLLIEHYADVNARAKNGLTPLHLCAQEDLVNIAAILVKNDATVDSETNAGYSPLHIACHFGQVNMVRFLLQHRTNVTSVNSHGYTPLHQAAQQGHALIINLLLEHKASPNVLTNEGQTALAIAKRLGYISVVETLKVVTENSIIPITTTVAEEKYKVVAPEIMQESFMSDSEDEGGEDTILGDQSMHYLTADEMKSLGDDSLPIDVTKDERTTDSMLLSADSGAPLTVEEDHLSPMHVSYNVETTYMDSYATDNIDMSRGPFHASKLKWKMFLVSFMVDARGGAMRGCRQSGVRVIIPPRKASMPMRITCRYLRKEKLIHPPPLMEGEACAARILEVGPVGAKFLGPIIIEIPHFTSLRGKEREIIILRSDNGEVWQEHTTEATEEAVQDTLNESFEGEEINALEDLNADCITRIVTTDFPQYFAIVSRVRQEVCNIGPEGGIVSSTVVPQVQAIFPEGALTKKIKVGLQAHPVVPELVSKMLGNRVGVSPIVTVEPRRRKFHKPITLTIPVPQTATKGMINQYSGNAPTLRLLCSISGDLNMWTEQDRWSWSIEKVHNWLSSMYEYTFDLGGFTKAQWEDVTGSTPLTFVNDCVSFTTTVSARFWLMDCRHVNEVGNYATELYREVIYVPFMVKFVVFAKRYETMEAELRVFCMTDDKKEKTLETQENFTEIAKSRDVEVLEGKPQFLELAGNLVPVTKAGEHLTLNFQPFRENRLPFIVRVKDPDQDPIGRIAFMREPRVGRGEPPQTPICNLNIALPDICKIEKKPVTTEVVEKKYDFMEKTGPTKPEHIQHADLHLSDIAQGLDHDWVQLADQLDVPKSDVNNIKKEHPNDMTQQALVMLRLWIHRSYPKATGNSLEKALREINREDIVNRCMVNVKVVTDDVEKAVAKVHLDQSEIGEKTTNGFNCELIWREFDSFNDELGSSRDISLRHDTTHAMCYDEQDIMKEAESAEEISSKSGSAHENQLPVIVKKKQEEVDQQQHVPRKQIDKLLKDEVNVELSVKLTPQKVMEQEEKKNIIMKHSIKQDPLSKFPEIQKKGRGLERLGKDVEVEVERLFFEELEKPVSCLEEIKLIDEKRVPLERSGKQDLKIDEISQKWDKPKKPEEDLGEEELSLLKMQENLKEKTTKEDKFIHEYENFVEKFELEEKLEKLEKEEQTLKVEPKIKPQIELETFIKKTKLVEENTENNKFQELNKSNKIASEIESYKSAIQSQEFEEQKPKELLKTVITEVENVDALKLVVESFEEKNKMFEKLEVEVKSVNKPEQYIQTETVGEKMFEETLETKTKPVEIGKETTEQENKFKDLVQPKDILTEVKEKKLENKELTEKTLTYMCKFPVTKEENEEWKLKKELENSGTIKHVVKPTHEKTEVDDQVFMEVERAEKERSVYEIESVLENLNMEYSKEIKAVIESKDFIDINVKKQKFEDLERSKKTINLVKSEPLIQMSEIKKQSFEEIIKQELVKIPVEQKSPVESSESQDQLLEELENPEVICEHVIELKVEERTQKSFKRPEIRSIVELVPVIEQPEVKKQILVESRRTTDNDFKVVIKTEDAVERPDVEDQKLEEVVMQMCKVKPVSEPVSIPDIRTFDSNSLITEQAEEKTFSLLDGPEKDLKLMPSDGPTTEELKAEPEQWTTTTSRQVASPSFPEDEQNELAIISMTTTPQNKPNTDLHTEEKEGTDTDESGAVQHVIQKQNSYVIKDENREHDSSVQHPTVTKGGTTFHVDLSFPTNPVYSYKIKQSPFSPSSPIPTTSCHVEQELSPAADYPVYLVPEMRVFVGISSKKSSDMNKYTFEDKKHVTRMEENISSESAYEFDPKNTNKQFTKICSSPFHNIYTEAQRIDYTCEDSVSKRCDTDVFTGNEEYVSSKVAQEESLNMHLPESSKAPKKDISYQETLNVYENTAFAGVDVIDKSAVEEENFEGGTSSYEILRETNKELPTLNPATNAVGAMKVDQEIYSHFLEQSLHLPINEGLLFSKVTPETTTYVEHHIKSQIFSEELDQSIEENTPEKKDILEGKNIKPTKVERVDIVTKQIRSAILAHELSEDTENDLPEEKDIPYDQRKEKKLSHELYDDTESDIPEEKAFPFDQGKDKISERYKAEGYEDKIEREDKVALNEAINILKPDSETSLNYKGKTEELEKEFAKEIIGFSRTSDEEQETQCSSVEYAMLETPIQQNSEQIYEKVKELREKQIIIEHNEKKTLEESISENEQIWQDDKLKKKFSEDYVSEGISPSLKEEEAVVAAKHIIEDIKTEVNLYQSLEHSLSEISDEDLMENLEEYIPIQQVELLLEGRDKSEEKKVSFSEDMPEILQNTISENEQSYRENEEETVKIKEELILGSKTNDDGYNDIHFAETTCHEQQISEHHKKLTANANSETKEESVHISGEHKDKSFPVLSTDTASIKINEILIQKDNIEDHTSLSVVNEETKDDQILVSYNEQVCFTESNFSEKAVINMCEKKILLNDICESKKNTDSYDIDMTFSDETQAAEKETETTECLGDFLPETLQQIHETSDSAEKETIKLSGSSVITTQSFVKDIPHQKATIIHKISKDIHKYCEEVITSDKKQKFQCSDESSDLQEDTLTKGQTCFEITVKSDEEKTSESDKSEKLSSGSGVQVASSDPSSASRKEKHLDKNCETYSSSGETESHYYTFDMSDSGKTTQSTPATSRPCSSEFDVNIYVVPISSEYETCATSQEVSASYATAYTSQETSFATAHSSRSQSSLESTHSVDSESSGHLASVEMSSEASETLVPSAQELEQEFQRGTETPTLEDEELISAFTPMEPYDSEIPETIIRRGVETPFLKEWKQNQSCDSSYSNMFGDKSQISEMEEVPSSPFEIITEEELADYPVDYLALVLQTDQFHNNKEGITCSTQAAKSKFKEHFQEEEVTKTRETNLESSGSELSATFVMESDAIQNTTTKYDEKTSTFSSNITDECYCSEKSAWKAKICKHESEVAASVEDLTAHLSCEQEAESSATLSEQTWFSSSAQTAIQASEQQTRPFAENDFSQDQQVSCTVLRNFTEKQSSTFDSCDEVFEQQPDISPHSEGTLFYPKGTGPVEVSYIPEYDAIGEKTIQPESTVRPSFTEEISTIPLVTDESIISDMQDPSVKTSTTVTTSNMLLSAGDGVHVASSQTFQPQTKTAYVVTQELQQKTLPLEHTVSESESSKRDVHYIQKIQTSQEIQKLQEFQEQEYVPESEVCEEEETRVKLHKFQYDNQLEINNRNKKLDLEFSEALYLSDKEDDLLEDHIDSEIKTVLNGLSQFEQKIDLEKMELLVSPEPLDSASLGEDIRYLPESDQNSIYLQQNITSNVPTTQNNSIGYTSVFSTSNFSVIESKAESTLTNQQQIMPCESCFSQFQTSSCTSEPFEMIDEKDTSIIKPKKNFYGTITEKDIKTVSSIEKPFFNEIHQGETMEIAQKAYGQQSVIELSKSIDDEFSIQGDQSDESISSLQEFEKLELAISKQQKPCPESIDSLLCKTILNSIEVNDIPSFQTECEQPEKECAEAEYSIVKEGFLKFSDDGFDSQERVEYADSSDSEEYEKRISDIANIIWQAQTNIEQVYSDHDQSLSEPSGFAFRMLHYNKTGSSASTESSLMEKTPSQKGDNDADSLDGNEQYNGQLAFKVGTTGIMKQALAHEKVAHSVVLPHDIVDGITVNNNSAEKCISHLQTLPYTSSHCDSDSFKEIEADLEKVKLGNDHKPYIFIGQGNEKHVDLDEDKDSLNDESDYSIQEDSLHEKMDVHAEEDSLHDDNSADVDSLAEENADKDSLLEEKDVDQDSLHEEMELPDDYEDILIDTNKSSKEIDNKISWSQKHPSEEEYDKDSLKDEFIIGQDINSNGKDIQGIRDCMISSTDSLEPCNYYATHANYECKTKSAMSSSNVNKFLFSGEESTMLNRSDSSVPEVALSYLVGNIPGITKTCQLSNKEQVEIFHKEDQFQIVSQSLTQPIQLISCFSEENDEHCMDLDTPQTLKTNADFFSTGKLLETKEETETVDEKGNSLVICGVKRNLQYEPQKISIEQEDNVEERFKSFLKKQTLKVEEENKRIEENQIVDEKENVMITRIRKTHLKSKPQIHKKICEILNAEEKTKEFFENFDSLQHATEDENYSEKIDEEGNVVCATQKFVKPDIHTITLSDLDAHKQMEDFTKTWSESYDDELMTKISHGERLQIHTRVIAHDSSGDDVCSTEMESYPTQPSQSTPTLSNIQSTFPLYNVLELGDSSFQYVQEWTSEGEQERQQEIKHDSSGGLWTEQSTTGTRSLTTHMITTTGANCQQYTVTDTSLQHGDRDEQEYNNSTLEILNQFMTDDGNQ